MLDTNEFFSWAFKGIIAGMVGLAYKFGWDLNFKVKNLENDLNDHKLYTEREYARNDRVDKAHERIDNKLDEISRDIKVLISKVKS